MKCRHWIALAATVSLGILYPRPAQAEAAWFQIDPVHTRVLFFIDHARFSRSIGLFRPVNGGLWFDADDWSNGGIDLCIPLAHLDMGDRAWEDALRRRDFFDAGKHPDACFHSRRVERIDDSRGRLHGEFTIRGTRKTAVIEFTLNDLRRFSLTMKRRLGISASVELSRSELGMTRDPTLIGDAVQVLIELEAQLADPPAGATRPPASASRP